MNKTQRLKALLARGYFPKELPPPFGTSLFSKKSQPISKRWAALVAAMKKEDQKSHPKPSKCVEYNMARRGHLRRMLAIPNPVAYYYLAQCIAENWLQVEAHISRSTISLTPAKIAEGDGRAVPMLAFSDLAQMRVRAYAPHRVVLQTDVANFYRAIYTHSIPWALHGKDIAKANRARTPAMFGNSIDFYVRQTQDGQTMGLPVGPDTSRIISEIVLAAIDAQAAGALGAEIKSGIRYIDDYFLCFDNQQDAAATLVALKGAVSAFELGLNADKTKIVAVSDFNEDTWPAKLQSIRIDGTAKRQGRDLVSFFSGAIEVAKSNPHESIASYALRLTTGVVIGEANWETYVSFLLRLCRENTNVLDAVAKIICTYTAMDYPVPGAVAIFLDGFLKECATAKLHFEIAWGIWLASSLGIVLSDDCINALEQVDNSVCALMLLHMQAKGLTGRAVDLSSWLPPAGDAALLGEHWLVMYEAGDRGWLDASAKSAVGGNDFFRELSANGVRFFDTDATNRPLQLPGVEVRLWMLSRTKKKQLLAGNVYVPKFKQGDAWGFAERLGADYGNSSEPTWFDPGSPEDDIEF